MSARVDGNQAAMSGFQVEASLFGGFRVEVNGEPIQPVGSKMARSLFALLIYQNDQHHMRSRLAGTFWPDTSELTARKRLSRALWQIRTACGAYPVIENQHDWIAISAQASVSVDVLEYESLLTGGIGDGRADDVASLARAVDLYRGDFMAGHYEPWVTEEQDRLRLVQQVALRRLVTLYQSHGSLEPALIAARRLVHIDPLDEDAHRQVMRTCVLLRRPEEAVRQYRECRSILAAELDAEPSPATVDLAEEVHAQLAGATVSRPKRVPVLAPVFIAREKERDVMIDALDRSLGGRGSVILLEGPGGIGKSSLVRQISDDARWRNLEVLSYSYDDTVSIGAFEAIREAVGPAITPLRAEQLADSVDDVWLAEAARIIPSVGRARTELTAAQLTGDDDRWRIREAIAQVLLSLARLQPTLLVLEDVHWADTDTLEVVERLAGAIGDCALVVCLAFRREEAQARSDTWRALTQIDRLPSSRRVVLGELEREDVVRLVTALGGAAASAELLADRLLEHAGGNPLFVVETVKSLFVDGGSISDALPSDMPLASNVTELVKRRLDRLDETALAVVGATSVFGRPVGVDELVELTELPRRDVLNGLSMAVQSHVLLDGESGCVFGHNLVKRVVYDAMVWNRRGKLHRRTAELLEGLAAPPAEIAHHKRAGKQWLDAMRFSRLAGDEARDLGAYQVAADHYARAMDAATEIDVDSSEFAALLESYESVADVLGDRSSQERLLEVMDDVAEATADRVKFYERMALFLAKTDDYVAALSAVEKGLAVAMGDDAATWRLTTVQAQIHEWSGDPGQAAAILSPIVDEIDEERTRAEALFILGGALAGTMQYKSARDALDESLEHFVSSREKWAEVRVRILQATVLSQIGMEDEADHTLLAAVETSRSIGYRRGEALASGNLGVRYKVTGQPGLAFRYFAAGIEAFQSVGHERGVAFCRANRSSLLLDVLGDVEGATADAQAALAYFSSVGHQRGMALAMSTLGSACFASGDSEEALALYREAIDIASTQGASWFGLQLRRSIARVLVETGRIDDAEASLDEVDEWLIEFPGLMPNLLALRALIAQGRGEESVAHALALEALVAMTAMTEYAHRVAYQCHRAMEADSAEAMSALERAYELVEDLVAALPADMQERARKAPDNDVVLRHRAAARPSTVQWSLPALAAPGGRPLTDDDLVVVEWTVAEPTDGLIELAADRRRHRLQRLLREAGAQGAAPTVKALAAALDASRATVKRDIAALRAQGESVTTRGTRP